VSRLVPRIRNRSQEAESDGAGGGIGETLLVAGLILLFVMVLIGLLYLALGN
jgi:hypothetical protein